jgi:hypothetical protein
MLRGFAGRVKPSGAIHAGQGIGEGTYLVSDRLLFGNLRLTNIGKEAWMSGPAIGEMLACFIQTERTVDGEANFGRIFVFLAVIFPPANWT